MHEEVSVVFSQCWHFPSMRISTRYRVLRPEHSQFPFVNHHSQLCASVMGTRKIVSWDSGMPKCGGEHHTALSAGAELMERAAQPQSLVRVTGITSICLCGK